MSSRRRRSRNPKIKQKRKPKTMVSAKRDEQKQKVMKKGCKKHVVKEKKCFYERDFLKQKSDFFREIKKEIKTNKKSICSQQCLD